MAAAKNGVSPAPSSSEFQQFLDTNQYSEKGITRYEEIFGKYYVSTGGKRTTAEFCRKLKLKPNQSVLDIGCGIGGSAFYMAAQFGVYVYGCDLSRNMVAIANKYRKQQTPTVMHRTQFHVEDATSMIYPDSFYDLVYSRDTILHIPDKLDLFKRMYVSLRPGGTVLITDYCKGDQKLSKDFTEYVDQRGYHLLTVREYGETLEAAGFADVEAIDYTDNFIEVLKRELSEYKPKKAEMVEKYSQEDFDYIVKGWEEKVKRCSNGDQVWGLFTAKKLF